MSVQHQVFRIVKICGKTVSAGVGFLCCALPVNAHASTFLDFSNGLTGWTQSGSVAVLSTTNAFTVGGQPYSLTPAVGDQMAKITPGGGYNQVGTVESSFGLTPGSISNLVSGTTNYGYIYKQFTLAAGTYSFAWAYAANDYQPFNDGVMFSVAGQGTQQVGILALNGASPTYVPAQASTLVLGSYGTTQWIITSFTISATGTYTIGFADFNYNDTSVSPVFYVASKPGTFTGNAVATTGGVPPSDIDTSTPYFSSSNLGTSVNPVFSGGKLRVDSATVASALSIGAAGGTIDQNGQTSTFTGVIADAASGTPGALSIVNNASGGSVTFTGVNTYTGATHIGAGATLALAGAGSIAASSGVSNDGVFDISGLAADTAVTSLSGSGQVALGARTLSLSNAAGTFDGTISGTGGLRVQGGTEVLAGNNTYSGGTTLAGGSLHVASDTNLGAAAGALTFHGGDLTITQSMDTARAIVIGAEGASLTTLAGVTLDASGPISGTGSLVKNGAGTLAVSGANTFTGGTLINGGTVQIGSGSSLGSGAIVLNGATLGTTASLTAAQQLIVTGASTVDVAAGTSAVLSGAIASAAGTACLSKSGGGALTIAGSASLASGACVAAGTLRANGSITGAVDVLAAGTLRGVGAIDGALSVSGRLAPGNSPGTLAVNGTVTMNPGSTFEVDIDGTGTGTGAGNYSRLLVFGANHPFVAAGTLAPLLRGITGDATNTFVPNLGDTYRIVTAEGGISGRFDTLAQPSDGLQAGTRLQAFYDMNGSNSIDLRVTPVSYATTLAAENDNARAAAALLDTIMGAQDKGSASALQSQLIYAVASAQAAQIGPVTKTLSGEIHADMAAAAPRAALGVQGQVAAHLSDIATGSIDHGQTLWANVTHGNNTSASDSHASGFTSRDNQVATGADIVRNATTKVGVGFAYTQTNVSADSGNGAIEESMGFVYGQHALGRVLIDGTLGYGAQSWDTHHADALGTTSGLTSGTHGRDVLAATGVRLPVDIGTQRLEPFARAIYQHVSRDASSEGAVSPAALSLDSYSGNGVRMMTGLAGGSRVQDPLAQRVTYRFTAAVGVDAGSLTRPSVDASLAGLGLTTTSPHSGRVFGQLGLDGTLRVSKNGHLFAHVEGEAAARRTAYGLTAGARVAF
ncbi:hypothetical protein BTHE68_45390 [Burkholderia sp. THE68]|uniref:autotransporter domain-containing protein n=1 Tax=Burkholderia sp. THE68 TaxID=758782 RepID=UPI001315C1A2|nr:autotransporter domain-containing protein [Burkholderia sp. THE68]BBU30805.1 hypothetical protein BTHE68_45390 [Burkholderia sp. THE68]